MSVRWGVAGTGGMAEGFVADLALVEGAELAFVGSRDGARAASFAAAHGSSTTGSGTYADLVAADVDVVYVATPHPQHHGLALACIRAGTPVLVEKAFTATLAGAREVADAAREHGVFCMEAMWTRFQPAVVRARELIEAGEIGDVLGVQADLGAFRDYDPAHRLFDPLLGGGAVLDLGVYVVSFAQHFLGEPRSVHATGTTFPNGADASAVIHVDFGAGRGAALVCSLTSQTPGRGVVMGTRGSLELGPRFHHPVEVVVRRNGHAPERIDLPAHGAGYTHEIDEVHRCLAAGLTESPVMPLSDTLLVQEVLEDVLSQLGITPAEADLTVSGGT